ncbi:3-methyladenine DNA glycosylase [Mycolicibacterium aichiense]|uniref:3-methyladenine DNA glycosylase n=1 Tax=Mycolicibacterium aichiense TaxID=1799 RepID=UPI003D6777A9
MAPLRERHELRVRELLAPYLGHRAEGRSHPVIDFLFTYYNLKPGQLQRWHPGYGVVLTGGQVEAYAGRRGYIRTGDGVTVSRDYLIRRRSTIDYVADLLTATASRPAVFGCFGLHEWAMVYETADVRHDSVPLRLGSAATNAVVAAMPVRCTHYDAFRFFTDAARPLNAEWLTREGQVNHEQPGCLHAGMDLYRFTAKLLPLVDSDLLMDAFELAFAARELDMKASPYDLSAWGYEAVRIETPGGRAEYARRQADLAQRARPIRSALIDRCRVLMSVL